MNLLEEILDSLNTTTVEQGKLSAAKSLDFFRSMEDLDYKVPVRKRDRGKLDVAAGVKDTPTSGGEGSS